MIQKEKDENYNKEEGLKKFMTDISGIIIGLIVYIILQTVI